MGGFGLYRIPVFILKVYKLCVSPYLGRNCRFAPTCSTYAIEAFERFGSIKGTWLSIKRICKCHPFHPGGVDPVPGNDEISVENENE